MLFNVVNEKGLADYNSAPFRHFHAKDGPLFSDVRAGLVAAPYHPAMPGVRRCEHSSRCSTKKRFKRP
jgi:hypothetical protein